MKTFARQAVSGNQPYWQARALLWSAALFLAGAVTVRAQTDPGGYTNFYIRPLMSWSFNDPTNWTSDLGYTPMSFTNLDFSYSGNFGSLVLDSTNAAWLQYNVTESSGTNNLTVDNGSLLLWFAPTSWAGTNQGGNGPGVWGRLLDVGTAGVNGDWWSLYVDDVGANIYFSGQTNGSDPIMYLSAPIAWATNEFHQIALTYSPTNTALYLDGVLATNGPGVTAYPGPDTLTNGFYIGSDSTGLFQAHGMFDDLSTYNFPLSAGTIAYDFREGVIYYLLNPENAPIISSADFVTSSQSTPDAITGLGALTPRGSVSSCATNSSVWMTNLLCTMSGTNATFTFSIAGGSVGANYDVFATSALKSPITNAVWAWLGQGQSCNLYSISNMPSAGAFFILGTLKDTDGDGLTDAYELLVSHTSTTNTFTDGSGLSDAWQVLLGLNPLVNQNAQPGTISTYAYTSAGWLSGVDGVRSGSVTNDAEGNVTQVSQ